MGQARQGYDSARQFFVNRGYVILMPNVRGSGGYGKKYHQLDDGDWGGAPLQDVLAGKRFLTTLSFVDADRVIVLGSSYGGYMVLSALTREPDAFAAGVDICGPSNLFTLLASVPPYWQPYLEYFHREVGDPQRDRERLRERSPLFAAQRIRAPLFVIHGANDPRVLRTESDQIVDAVRKNGGIVEYMVFPDEGHELRKKDNRIAAFGAVLNFLEKHTKRDEPVTEN
jgi:dipeptidyl aminopeptidase/acylaminoacyl peptidase